MGNLNAQFARRDGRIRATPRITDLFVIQVCVFLFNTAVLWIPLLAPMVQP